MRMCRLLHLPIRRMFRERCLQEKQSIPFFVLMNRRRLRTMKNFCKLQQNFYRNRLNRDEEIVFRIVFWIGDV